MRVLILRAPGTNCDQETAFAFEQAGATAEVVHVNRLLENKQLAQKAQTICLPGGFSYGDDVAAGRIVAGQIRHHLMDVFQSFRDEGKLILGICNGFQILLKSGLLADPADNATPPATLTWNDSGKFEDRWVHLAATASACPFLADIDRMYLPIAHAEGKFVARDPTTLEQLESTGQLALRYALPPDDGPTNQGQQQLPFPANPNGSEANVAGACDRTGRVFGLMPHPERYIHSTHHPQWTRLPANHPSDGLKIFQNAVRYFA